MKLTQQAVTTAMKGRTGRWLANELGVSTTVVSYWTRGERPIPVDRLHQLGDVLDVNPWTLVDDLTEVLGVSPEAGVRDFVDAAGVDVCTDGAAA